MKQARPPAKVAVQPSESSSSGNGEQALQVGDIVMANGKRGVLAFLGTTQFAKGNWAGIILDTLEGKNNGSVNGVRYFDCEPNRGLFAKPEKIKFVSRGASQTGQPARLPPAPTNAAARTTSPTASRPQCEVGDRVLVDGQKEGFLGFLGTTQFARGVWAGVVLDTPEGKNDGTVSGVRYFDCRPNYGLFTRPQKLRLIARAADQDQMPPSTSPSVQDEGQGSSQPTPTPGPTDLKVLHDKLQVGDQVLVGGVKEGILRYLGPTEFAKGIWVGVELPEPMGKNDGAISGKRWVAPPGMLCGMW